MSCEFCYFEHNDKRIGPCSYCKEQDKNEPKYSIGQFVEISPQNYVGHIENIYTSEDGTEETLYHVKGFHEGKPFVLIKKESELSKLKAIIDPDKLAKITYRETDAVVKGCSKHEDRLYLDNTLSIIISQLALNSSYLQHVLKLLCEDHKLSADEIDEKCKKHAKTILDNIAEGIKESEKAKEKENENA